MPVTKSAKKAAKQAQVKTERNKPVKSKMKTMIKKVMTLKKDDAEAAKKTLPEAYKAIDMAAKKNLIHKKNAARKKSQLAKAISSK